jgi:hypothetical protein
VGTSGEVLEMFKYSLRLNYNTLKELKYFGGKHLLRALNNEVNTHITRSLSQAYTRINPVLDR